MYLFGPSRAFDVNNKGLVNKLGFSAHPPPRTEKGIGMNGNTRLLVFQPPIISCNISQNTTFPSGFNICRFRNCLEKSAIAASTPLPSSVLTGAMGVETPIVSSTPTFTVPSVSTSFFFEQRAKTNCFYWKQSCAIFEQYNITTMSSIDFYICSRNSKQQKSLKLIGQIMLVIVQVFDTNINQLMNWQPMFGTNK